MVLLAKRMQFCNTNWCCTFWFDYVYCVGSYVTLVILFFIILLFYVLCHLFLLHTICIMFGGVSDHLVLLLLINLIWFGYVTHCICCQKSNNCCLPAFCQVYTQLQVRTCWILQVWPGITYQKDCNELQPCTGTYLQVWPGITYQKDCNELQPCTGTYLHLNYNCSSARLFPE